MTSLTDEFSVDHPQNKGCGFYNRLLPLGRSDPGYVEVEKYFREGWRHPNKKRPRIHTIFRIALPERMLKPFHKYRETVAAELDAESDDSDSELANEQLLFHGTTRCCLLGDDTRSTRICTLRQCSLCCVIRYSFDVKRCGSKHRFKRFGKGIYTTSCSSKADDYTANQDDISNLRALLLSRVVVGNPYRRQQNATGLTEPPPGYHSVVGEPGIDLNYEETVVFHNDAIRPAYLIVYGDPPSAPNGKILRKVIKTLFNTPLAS